MRNNIHSTANSGIIDNIWQITLQFNKSFKVLKCTPPDGKSLQFQHKAVYSYFKAITGSDTAA